MKNNDKTTIQKLNEINKITNYHLRMYYTQSEDLSITNMISDMMLIKNILEDVTEGVK